MSGEDGLLATFMTELLISLALASCPATQMINKTAYPWNDNDKQTMKYCQRRCSDYYPDAPCLKQFIKWNKQDYHCLCGI
jgi:hypothetical protein